LPQRAASRRHKHHRLSTSATTTTTTSCGFCVCVLPTTKAHLKARIACVRAFLFMFWCSISPHKNFSFSLLNPMFRDSFYEEALFFVCREEGPIFCTFFLIGSLHFWLSVSFSLSLSLLRRQSRENADARRKHTSPSSFTRWALRRAPLRRRSSNPTTRKNRLPKVLPRHHHRRQSL